MRRAYEIAELAPGLDLLVGADDVVLELAARRARPAGSPAIPTRFPRACVDALPGRRRGRPGRRAAALPAAAPAAALGLQDRVRPGDQAVDGPVGRYGGPCRPPRGPLTAEHDAAVARRPPRRPSPRAAAAEDRCARSGSSTRSTRTPRACRPASITGGVGVDPRRHHGRAAARTSSSTCDDLRHAADVRAARARGDERRDPAAADPARRRLRRALHRGVRLPADVRARHDRRRHRAGRDRHGRGRPSRSPPSGWTPRPGWSCVDVAVEDGARDARSRSRNVPVVHASPSTRRSTCPGFGDGRLRPGVRRQLLRHRRRWTQLGLPFDRGRKDRHARRRAGHHGRDQRAGPAGAPARTRASAAATTSTSPRPARTPATPGTPWRSTPAGSTARPAAPAPRARMAQLHARGELPLDTGLRQRVVHRHRASSAGWSRRPPSAACPAVVPTVTGRAWITGTAQYLLDPGDPFPAGFVL